MKTLEINKVDSAVQWPTIGVNQVFLPGTPSPPTHVWHFQSQAWTLDKISYFPNFSIRSPNSEWKFVRESCTAVDFFCAKPGILLLCWHNARHRGMQPASSRLRHTQVTLYHHHHHHHYHRKVPSPTTSRFQINLDKSGLHHWIVISILCLYQYIRGK